jgi:ABC-2 type transport system permease protein
MFAIFRKEFSSFLASPVAFVVLFVFLVSASLFLWWFPDTSILENNFATLHGLFYLAPALFVLLIPAITMRMLAEETQTGTIELLVTRPLSDWQIVLGKFFAALVLVIVALIPTLIYYYSVYQLGEPKGNLDSGGILGSYIGLISLAAVFCAIGIFASSLTSNQIISFILAAFLCALCYLLFELISRLPIFFGKTDDFVERLGLSYHYESISRGVIDTRDMVYFLSLIVFFLSAAVLSLSRRRW